MKEERLEEESERVKRVLPVAPAIEEGAVIVFVRAVRYSVFGI